jgi:hypothetical protein
MTSNAKPRVLSPETFIDVWSAVAESFGRPASDRGSEWLYTCLIEAVPNLPELVFMYAAKTATQSCRFMPTLADLLDAICERDATALPPLPDIDPRYANEFQQGVYYRALAERDKALKTAPHDTTRFKPEVNLLLANARKAAMAAANGASLAAGRSAS